MLHASQVLETVLSYLELGDGLPEEAPLVSTLPEMRATIFLSFHKSDPEALAATSPLVEHVLKLGKARGGKHSVSVPQLATSLGVSFAALQEQLQQLAATGEVSYTSSDDRALCMQARARSLRMAASAVADAVHTRHRLCACQATCGRSLPRSPSVWLLRSSARWASWTRFTRLQRPPRSAQSLLSRRRSCAATSPHTSRRLAAPNAFRRLLWCVCRGRVLHGRRALTRRAVQVKQSSQHLLGDIRALLRQARDVLTSSRMVARVLHGLAGAHVSADAWRHNTAWNRHAAVDFNAVMRAAEAELTAGHT